MSKKSLNILISGRVQGVFFRASATDMARSLDIVGRVMNMPDGSVYIAAEGDERALEQFVSWCRQGPPAARVDKCEVSQGEIKGYTRFEIQR